MTWAFCVMQNGILLASMETTGRLSRFASLSPKWERMSSYLLFIETNVSMNYIYMYISATDHQKGISMQMTSTTPATSLFISLHTNNTLYLSSSIPPLQRQLANYYTSTLQSPSAAKCSNLVPPSLHQKTNLSMGLMYCYMLYVHVMGKPASHLFSSLQRHASKEHHREAFFRSAIII